ncbi:hypothetical protein KSP40_PGU014869 [Platanthera guangdongensis]|uniref:Uncharacterized protein n=1 Tax=Platanthera guangdongensis TaxID=2320717 RepID=A0ABR2MAE3_9ASPA
MRETVPNYPNLIHRVEAQIAADEAINAHRQQFKGGQKRKRRHETSTRKEKKSDAGINARMIIVDVTHQGM